MAVPLLVFSPHLDDAVFSCGALIAETRGAVVATIFAGRRRPSNQPGEWDVRCEFGSAKEAIDARRAEDAAALARLGATPKHGPAQDNQYSPPMTERRAKVRNFIERLLSETEAPKVMVPLGLLHPDHTDARNQTLYVYKKLKYPAEWWFYADLPYFGKSPELLNVAQAQVEAQGYTLGEQDYRNGLEARKIESVGCYESQTKVLFPDMYKETHLHSEHFWRLVKLT